MARRKKAGGGGKGPPKGKKTKHLGRRNNVNAPSGPGLQNVMHAASFSLRDEARNTERHRSIFAAPTSLRGKHVNFVSAGMLHGDDLFEDPASPTATIAFADMQLASDSEEHFFVDTTGSEAVSTGLSGPIIRSPSPIRSVSSDDEIVIFKGRQSAPTAGRLKDRGSIFHMSNEKPSLQDVKSAQPQLPVPTLATTNEPIYHGTPEHILKSSPSKNAPILDSQPDRLDVESQERLIINDKPVSDHTHGQLDGKPPSKLYLDLNVYQRKPSEARPDQRNSGNGAPRGRSARHPREHTSDEAMKDYIDNLRQQMQCDGSFAEFGFTPRDLSLHDANDRASVGSDNAQETVGCAEGHEDWNSITLDDFDGLSSSSDVTGHITRILAKRHRKHGPQYLIQYEDFAIDDARWLSAGLLTSESDVKLIEEFEAKLSLVEYEGSYSTDDSDQAESEHSDDVDDFQDEKDLIARKSARMTDEQIARRLAKQEELGLGSDQVILFDDEDGVEDVFDPDNVSVFHSILGGSTRSARRHKHPINPFPSASLMADVLDQDPYNGFDVMDTERPSLQRKKKGRPTNISMGLSDSETEAHLRAVWEADRKTKRTKKAEREQLRAQGLLGRKNNFKPNLSQKYKDGFSMAEIVEEIRTFLSSEMASCSLPPMEAHERAYVHRLALKLGLSSKSRGSRQDRFTVIAKTTRTPSFDDDIFDRVIAQRSFRFGPTAPRGARNGRSGGKPASGPPVSYRNGEVVGARAPEIAVTNRGRRMLEKMGWSSGTALGAQDNKGILQPIVQTVRTGKAGL